MKTVRLTASQVALWVAWVALGASIHNGAGAIIPANRRIDWTPGVTVGVPGGIPNRTTIFRTLGPTATAADINTAISQCPSGQVVKLNPGTYNISSTLRFGFAKGVTLRGSGMSTVIRPGSIGEIVTIGADSGWSGGTAITAGYAKGASNLTVASTSGLAVGYMVRVDQLNDPSFVWSTGGQERLINQVTRIRAIAGNVVTVWPPLYYGLTPAGQPLMKHLGGSQAELCGVEDMHFDCTGRTVGEAVWIDQAFGCWIKNVRCTLVNNYNLLVTRSLQCEIAQAYCDDSLVHGPNHGGVVIGSTSSGMGSCGTLVYDCIINRIFPSIEVNAGSAGNVFAYNFIRDPFYDDFGQGVGLDVNHLPHNMMTLCEGNVVNMIQNDGYFGSSSHHTYFRNWSHGWTDVYGTYNSKCISLNRWSLHENMVGNVWGCTNFTPNYLNITLDDYDYALSTIYQFGYPNMGNNNFNGTRPPSTDKVLARDLNVEATALIHGNWDSKTKTVVWDPNIPDRTLPPSLYLANKAPWMGNLPWPMIGPDVNVAGNVNPASRNITIPARERYYGRTNYLNSSGNQSPAVTALANRTSGLPPLAVNFSCTASDPEGSPLTYNWTFGDGTSSTQEDPSKTYNSEGDFTAFVIVSDGTNSTRSSDILIRVGNQPPVAAIAANPTSGAPPLAVTFSSAGSSDPEGATLTYNWAFGDGSTSTQPNPSYTYPVEGTFTASVRVSDGAKSATNTVVIQVRDIPPALVAAYSFDEGTGTVLTDSSGNGNNGTLSGPVWTAQGKNGGALTFDGVNDLVIINSSVSLNVTTEMTLEAWIRPTASQSGWKSVLHREPDAYYLNSSNPNGAMLPAGGGVFNGTEVFVSGPTANAVNGWTHLAVTFNGTTLRLFVNGTQVATQAASGSVQTNSEELRIGGNTYAGQFFQGQIDDLRIYGRALSAAEIQTDMNTAVGGQRRPATPTGVKILSAQ